MCTLIIMRRIINCCLVLLATEGLSVVIGDIVLSSVVWPQLGHVLDNILSSTINSHLPH